MKRTHQEDDDDEMVAEPEEEEEDDDDDSDNDDDFEEMNMNKEEDEDEEDLDGTKQQHHLESLERNSTVDTTTTTSNSTSDTANNDAFMDSFYGISSSDVRERTIAAQVMIQHCLLSSLSSTSNKSKFKSQNTTTTDDNDDDDDHDPTVETQLSSVQRKDAAYALRRLMNGLCSGRASARQGNAATLASFLVLARPHFPSIRQEWYNTSNTNNNEEEIPPSDLSFLRDALLSVTEPKVSKQNTTGGKSRGSTTATSDERDYKLGRLFGITAIIRSGILQQILLQHQQQQQQPESPNDMTSTTNTTNIEKDLLNLVTDLIQLYMYKKWIREAVAHAICSLLYTIQGHPHVWLRLVEDGIRPQLLSMGDSQRTITTTTTNKGQEEPFVELISSYSVEQIAIAMCIQSIVSTSPSLSSSSQSLSLLHPTVLCTETVPYLAAALCQTAGTVAPPRIHFVWDILLQYISESISPTNTSTNDTKMRSSSIVNEQRQLQVTLSLLPEGDTVNDLVCTLVQSVILEGLMGVSVPSITDGKSNPMEKYSGSNSNKSMQDKHALALALIRNFMSVPFTVSITPNPNMNTQSQMRLILTTEQIENLILTPTVVQHLFVNVICSGGKGKPHSCKSLATEVLDQIVDSLLDDTSAILAGNSLPDDSSLLDDIIQKRVAIAFIMLRCDARFDAKTKTLTVERLLGLSTNASNVTDDDEEMDNNNNNAVLKSTWKPYMTFLEHQIIGDQSTKEIRSNYEIQGYIDLLYQFGKIISRNAAIPDIDGIQRIYGFLLTVAFFNCSTMEAAESTETVTKKKKKNKRQSIPTQNHKILEIARMIQDSRSKLNASPILSYEVRSAASARFFSLVTDSITTIIHSSSPDKESNIINLLSNLHAMLSHLVGAGAKKVVTITPSEDMDTDAEAPPELVVKHMIEDAQASVKLESKDATVRWKNGCAILGSTLFLHLLSSGHADVGNDENVDPNADDDEDYEETVGLLNDLQDIASAYSENAATSDDAPLPALAELCARILSSPLAVGNQSRGASPTLLRDAVKLAWTGGLSLSASLSQDDASALDKEVVNILLNALGAIDDTTRDDNENDDSEDDDEDGSDDDESEDKPATPHEAPSTNFTGIDLNDEKMGDNEDDDGSDDELQIDPERLKTLLAEESDADVDEAELEHHEGADAALAKLIQLKQDARKAGTLARERSEIARQIRCIVLLETLVVGKDGNWGSLLRVDLLIHMMVPILKYRNEIVKSLSKAMSKGSNSGSNEKAALLSKLTALLKNKVLKAKVSDMEWTDSIDVSETSTTFLNVVMKQALDSDDKEQQSLCNSCIMHLLRCITDSSTKLKSASIYSDAVSQWSTKRTTRLDSTFFEGLLHQNPVLAQACLTEALATAATNGRTTYLKSEAFRLLSMLYNPKLNSGTTDFDRVALAHLIDSTPKVLASITFSLNDTEMKKTKRIRDVLKAAEKIIHFLSVSSNNPPNCVEALSEMTKLLQVIKGDSESHGIVNSVTNLISSIDNLVAKGGDRKQSLTNDPAELMDSSDPVDEMELEDEPVKKQDKSKKKKNKSKKKKK